jgi:hypothetical protein
MCVKIAAMVRTFPGGLAFQAAGLKMLDENLVHAPVCGKGLDRRSTE